MNLRCYKPLCNFDTQFCTYILEYYTSRICFGYILWRSASQPYSPQALSCDMLYHCDKKYASFGGIGPVWLTNDSFSPYVKQPLGRSLQLQIASSCEKYLQFFIIKGHPQSRIYQFLFLMGQDGENFPSGRGVHMHCEYICHRNYICTLIFRVSLSKLVSLYRLQSSIVVHHTD